MPQTKEQHAEYVRNWRLKQKEKQDEIEKQLNQQANKIKQVGNQPQRTKKELTILSDSWGSEPQATLTPQYPKQEESYGVNAWGSSDSSEQPKPQSNQDILRQLDERHSE